MKTLLNKFLSASTAYRQGGRVLASVLPTSVVTLALGLAGCGSSLVGGLGRDPTPVKVKLEYLPPVAVNLENMENKSMGLGLVSTGTSLAVSVDGCASGYTVGSAATPQTITSVVNLYNGDYTCLVKLQRFTLGATSYSSVATGATNFSTWTAGSVATFANVSSSTDTIKVYVIQQVDSPLSGSSAVIYKFTDIASATTSSLGQSAVSTPVPLTVQGQTAPNFTLVQGRYLSTNSNGSGNLSFTLACGTTVSGTGASETCSGVNLTTQLDYIFIPDAYSQGAITVGQANSAFGANTPTAITATGTGGTGTTIAAGGTDLNSNTVTNGGFHTSNSSPLITGSTPIYPSNLAYVFILRQRDGSGNTMSYLYFYVNIASITQS